MKKLLNYIFGLSSGVLFLSSIFLSIILVASFFFLAINHETLIIKESNQDLTFLNLTLLGKFFIFSGIIPNFFFLIFFFRAVKDLIRMIMNFIGWIMGIIFSNKNFDMLEKVIETNKPVIKKTVGKLDIKKSEYEIFWIVPIVALAIGFLPMPFGYYIISRLIVSGCALYFAVKFYKQQDNFKPWIFGFLVVLYNPIVPMPLGSKELWMIVNIPTIYYFFINRRS
jgi:hypothetical protein